MSEDSYPTDAQIVEQITAEDLERARQIANNPEEIARLIVRARLDGIAAVMAHERLERSRVDKLSGLLNHDAFIEDLSRLHQRLNSEHRRAGDPDGAFMYRADIMDMHGLNKRYGQVGGDEAIMGTAEWFKTTFRMDEGDILARGGAAGAASDEFTAVTPYYLRHNGVEEMDSEEIRDLLWKRLESRWEMLEEQGITSRFRVVIHCAAVEKGKSLDEIAHAADPKAPGNLDKAMVFGRGKPEPYSEVLRRENRTLFERIFGRRQQ